MRLSKNIYKQGFTVVEIMCVLVIISIVSSIAMPAISNFHSAERCKAEASVLVSYIRQAKYQAMQDNCLNRIAFLKDGDTATAFKVQKFEKEDSLSNLATNISSAISADKNYTKDESLYNAQNWESIADTEELEFNSSVEVDLSLFSPRALYFMPDGYIYDTNNAKITEQRIIFKYGSSAVAVDINALGVISSEAIPVDDNDYDNDKGKEEDENEND